VRRTQGREVLPLEDGPAVLARLDRVLGLDALPAPAGDPPAVVLALGDPRVALVVETLDGAEDLVVTPLPRPLERVRHATGAAVLGTGEIAIVLNAAELARSAALRSAADPVPAAAAEEPPAPARARRVMVVDDSIVTRMLEKGILEAAGYEVAVAADGEEAWRALQSGPCDCLVSDVDMPGMSGLELVARVRADARLAALPVVVVTSLGSPEDHARAMEAGADAYIVKSSFSQEGLLATVGRLA